MTVLPDFDLIRPATLTEAVAALARPGAQALAGGTDLIVNLRRGLGAPALLVDLGGLAEIAGIAVQDGRLSVGAGVTLRALAESEALGPAEAAIREAALAVAGPGHRNAATVGGNLCLDTRCVYYNQSHWWRKANGYCLKYRGDICHVAPKGNRCRAAFSGDLAPAFMALGAEAEIAGPGGTRMLPLADLYREDGADHLALEPGEILTRVTLPRRPGRSAYVKLRQRGAIDFPLAGAAVVCRSAEGGNEIAVALTGTNSRPLLLPPRLVTAAEGDAVFARLAKDIQKAVSPQRTTVLAAHFRRLSIAALAARTARELADV